MGRYLAIAQMVADAPLGSRITAAAALERIHNPELWVMQRRWLLVARTDWADAWNSAAAGGVPDPGASDSVVTDQMILSAVQSVRGGDGP